MNIEVKNIDKGQVELTIELSVEEFQPFLNTAAKTISENSPLAGFRPGKADLQAVINKVGEEKVWQEALEPAVQKTLVKTLDEKKIITVGAPKIDVLKLAPGNPISFKATMALLPNLEMSDLTDIKIEKKEVKVDEEKINKTLNDIRKMRAKESLQDKKAEKGDKVEIDFDIFLDKVPVDQGASKKMPVVIGENSFIPGFEDQLLGLKKDDTKEFKLEFPKTYHQKNLAGKLVDFKVKVNGVYKVELPELNDDLAKGMGQFKNLEELKTQVKNNIIQEETQKEDQKFENEILDAIIEKSKYDDIPDVLINSETQKMMQELKANISQQGIQFEEYLTHLKKKEEDMLLDFVPQAIKRVKSALIIRKVIETQGIKATDEEIEAEIQKALKMYAGNADAESQLKKPEYKDYLNNILTSRKAVDYLKSTCTK